MSLILAIVRKSKPWTIATIIAGLVLVVGLVGSVVYGVKEGVKQARVEQIFALPDGSAQITGLAGWKEQALGSDDASLEVGNLFREEYLIVIVEPKSDFDPGFTLAEYEEVVSDLMSEIVEEAEVSAAVAATISGLEALESELEGRIDGIDVSYLNTFIEGDDRFYQIITWTLTSQKDSTFPRLREAARSFREVGTQSLSPGE